MKDIVDSLTPFKYVACFGFAFLLKSLGPSCFRIVICTSLMKPNAGSKRKFQNLLCYQVYFYPAYCTVLGLQTPRDLQWKADGFTTYCTCTVHCTYSVHSYVLKSS
jgi:hypothetical protein